MSSTAAESMSETTFQRDLGEGLLLRWSTSKDAERVASLHSSVFRSAQAAPPNAIVAAWTRDLMSGRHPLCTPDAFAVVEDKYSGAIVAAAGLLSQIWDYDGLSFSVGRPELVATALEYRHRGLIRSIFALLHARSAARGDLALGIVGNEYYYRQFGYEYALDLGGSRTISLSAIPDLAAGESEPYQLRDAVWADLPLVLQLYDRERTGRLVSAHADERLWGWTLDGISPQSTEGFRTQLIVAASSSEAGSARIVGYVLPGRSQDDAAQFIWGLSIEPGVSLVAVLPSVLRALRVQALQTPGPDMPAVANLRFALGRTHPVYDVLEDTYRPARKAPYAWYVRVPDLPVLIRHLAPSLERRLSGSVADGYTGELTLDFYRGGLRLVLKNGRISRAENWKIGPWEHATAGFPPLVFLQLLFGHRSLDELGASFPDVWTDPDVAPVLRALFPRQVSRVVPFG